MNSLWNQWGFRCSLTDLGGRIIGVVAPRGKSIVAGRTVRGLKLILRRRYSYW